MMSSGAMPLAIASARSSSSPLRSPSTMRSLRRPSTVSARFLAPRVGGLAAGEDLQQPSAAGRSPRGGGRRSGPPPPRTSSGAIRCSGLILETWTMAPVMPAFTAWSRNTLFSTCRAAGFRPKEMLDRPRMIWMSGNSSRIMRMPSSVHWPSLRSSSLPVAMVKVSGSISRSDCGRPCWSQANSTSRRAMRELVLGGLRHADLVDGQRDDGGAELLGEHQPVVRVRPRRPRS